MLHPQPRRKASGDGPRRGGRAGVTQEKLLHRRQLQQCLSYGYTNDPEHKTERQDPQNVEPMPPNPDLWYDANLWRQPVVQENPVVRRTESRFEEVMQGRVSACHMAHISIPRCVSNFRP